MSMETLLQPHGREANKPLLPDGMFICQSIQTGATEVVCLENIATQLWKDPNYTKKLRWMAENCQFTMSSFDSRRTYRTENESGDTKELKTLGDWFEQFDTAQRARKKTRTGLAAAAAVTAVVVAGGFVWPDRDHTDTDAAAEPLAAASFVKDKPVPKSVKSVETKSPTAKNTPAKPHKTEVATRTFVTWNAYYRNKRDVGQQVDELFKATGAGVIGLQEATRHQKSLAKIACDKPSCKYDRFPTSGSLTTNTIIWDKAEYEVVDTYAKITARDLTKRALVYVLLKDRETGQLIYYVNGHAPHKVDAKGHFGKNKSQNKAYKTYAAISQKTLYKLIMTGVPTLYGGDFNVAERTDTCKTPAFPCAANRSIGLESAWRTTIRKPSMLSDKGTQGPFRRKIDTSETPLDKPGA